MGSDGKERIVDLQVFATWLMAMNVPGRWPPGGFMRSLLWFEGCHLWAHLAHGPPVWAGFPPASPSMCVDGAQCSRLQAGGADSILALGLLLGVRVLGFSNQQGAQMTPVHTPCPTSE